MSSLGRFLRERPLVWIAPIVVLYGALFWLALQAVKTPSSPFTYRVDF